MEPLLCKTAVAVPGYDEPLSLIHRDSLIVGKMQGDVEKTLRVRVLYSGAKVLPFCTEADSEGCLTKVKIPIPSLDLTFSFIV